MFHSAVDALVLSRSHDLSNEAIVSVDEIKMRTSIQKHVLLRIHGEAEPRLNSMGAGEVEGIGPPLAACHHGHWPSKTVPATDCGAVACRQGD